MQQSFGRSGAVFPINRRKIAPKRRRRPAERRLRRARQASATAARSRRVPRCPGPEASAAAAGTSRTRRSITAACSNGAGCGPMPGTSARPAMAAGTRTTRRPPRARRKAGRRRPAAKTPLPRKTVDKRRSQRRLARTGGAEDRKAPVTGDDGGGMDVRQRGRHAHALAGKVTVKRAPLISPACRRGCFRPSACRRGLPRSAG